MAGLQVDEVWSIVWAYKYAKLKRIDRLFEMHPIWAYEQVTNPLYAKPIAHLAWLKANKTIPVTLAKKVPGIQADIFPYEKVTSALLGTWKRSGEQAFLYTSSFDYMIAKALYDGFTEIHVVGAEMASDSEYRYQREGFAFWAGVAVGRKVHFNQYAPSRLLYKPKVYGRDRAQMIARQDLEREGAQAVRAKKEALAHVQFAEGVLYNSVTALEALREDKKNSNVPSHVLQRAQEGVQEAEERLGQARLNLAQAQGAVLTLERLLKHLDLEELEEAFDSPFQVEKTNAD